MSRRRVLDTNILIGGWKRGRTRPLSDCSVVDAQKWADDVIQVRATNAIVTPVEIEFLCGVASSHELVLARAFLARFDIIDGGDVTAADWNEARRIAQWIRGGSLHRQLGDCLILAITTRLRFELDSLDQGIPRGNPR